MTVLDQSGGNRGRKMWINLRDIVEIEMIEFFYDEFQVFDFSNRVDSGVIY